MKKKFPRTNLIKRTSTIANAMAHSIIFKEDLITEYQTWLDRFNQKENNERCVYCDQKATSVDHVYNLVKNGLPTGYNTERNNLVPCCSTCNSKKGSKVINDFFNTDYFKSISGYQERQRKLNTVLMNYKPLKLDFKLILKDDFNKYVKMKDELNKMIIKFDSELIELRNKIDSYVKKI
jgi:hypothetical protein